MLTEARKLTSRVAGIQSDADALAAEEAQRFAWVRLAGLDAERDAIRRVYAAPYSMTGISPMDARYVDEYGFRHFRRPEEVWAPATWVMAEWKREER